MSFCLLHEDIAEMFSVLAGRDRYSDALERICEEIRHQRREYTRDYHRYRYRLDPEFRARHKAAVDRYKDRLLGSDRPRRIYGPIQAVHGSYLAYSKRRCRCAACRSAAAAYQRQRRAARKAS